MNVLLRQVPGLTHLPSSRSFSSSCLRFVVTELTHKTTPTIGSPTDNRLRDINFPPFVKDLFAGEFNRSVLSYAEVLNYERYFVLQEQTRQLNKFLGENKDKLACINERGVVPDEILAKMKSLDLHGLLVPAKYGGAELMQTEVARLYQELGADLSLSELFSVNELMCTKAIVRFGTEEQKLRYLGPISSGDLWTAYCLAEKGAGSDPNGVEAKVVWDDETEMYRLSGTKTWVANAIRANLFLVFANLKTKNYLGEDDQLLSAFLVDKNTPGVELSSPYNLAAFNGLQVCDVKFDCLIPKSALLGEDTTNYKYNK